MPILNFDIEDASDYYFNKISSAVEPNGTGLSGSCPSFEEMLSKYQDYLSKSQKLLALAQSIIFEVSDLFNDRIGKHFLAEQSRWFLSVLDNISGFNESIQATGYQLVTAPSSLWNQLMGYYQFLSESGGSELPPNILKLNGYLLQSKAVFAIISSSSSNTSFPTNLIRNLIGSGSYADVYECRDSTTGYRFAIKKAKDILNQEELKRFHHEYEVLQRLDSPHIIEVYNYDNAVNEYAMEYVPLTLFSYIRENNRTLTFKARKNIALDFLRGLNYIHRQGLCHRDLSLNNVLIRPYQDGNIAVKISDFGLVKENALQMTRTNETIKGSLIDPALETYNSYKTVNDIYSAGRILEYIFYGRLNISIDTTSSLDALILKAINHDVVQRYQNVTEMGKALKQIDNIN
jgi:tRNA A-37 threonylcarbamoyl transferase component Bud32